MSKAKTDISFQAVLALTEQLTGGSRFRLPWTQIRGLLDDLTEGHFWLVYPINKDLGIFRGRIENSDHLFTNVCELSNRKPEDVKDYGRCHKPGVSIFYAANNLDTVLSELRPEIGDRLQVSIAKPRKGQDVVLTAIGEIDHVRRYGQALIGNEESKSIYKNFLDNISSETDLKALYLDAFMSDLFISPARRTQDYKATSALSDIILSAERDGKRILDGFAYPSVAHRGGLNFAIRGEKFAQCMEVDHCMAFEIMDYFGYGIYGRRQYAKSTSIASDGTIEWESL